MDIPLGFNLANPSVKRESSGNQEDKVFPKGRAATFSWEVKILLVSDQLHSSLYYFHLTTKASWALPTLLFIEYELAHSKMGISS